ncbi:MAG: hypothetical protein J7J61_03345 [Candidatus Hydrothermae bacterium]|nr:hypothetical protein [Candidatus Hydrothermae bacterium]
MRKTILKQILLIFATSLVFILTLSFALKPRYTSRASFIPVITGIGASSNISMMGEILSTLMGRISGPAQLYTDLIHSRVVLDSVINNNNLRSHYKVRYKEEAEEILKSRLKVEISPSGMVKVQYSDDNPKLSQKVLSDLLYYLDLYNINSLKKMKEKVISYLQIQLRSIEDSINIYQRKLIDFETKNKTIIMDKEVQSFINLYGTYKLNEYSLRLTKNFFQEFLKDTSPYSMVTKSKLNALNKLLARMEKESTGGFGAGFNIPLGKIPSLLIEYVNLKEKLEAMTLYYYSLKTELEKLKIDTEKPISSIKVIDKPEFPEKRSWPKTKTFLLVGILFNLVILSLLYLYKYYYPSLKNYWENLMV